MTGTCKFCNQTMIVADVDNQADADEYASRNCNCNEGRAYRNIEDMKEEAKENARSLFEIDNDVPFPEDPSIITKNQKLIKLMDNIIDSIAEGAIKKSSIKIDERVSATIYLTKNGGIDTIRSYKDNQNLSANLY